jgi:hypothetical protein
MICYEITAAINNAGVEQTFYVSDTTFVSKNSDTPANQWFTDAALESGSFSSYAFSDGRTSGNTLLQTGEIVLANDGRFDAWKDYSFGGRKIVIRMGTQANVLALGYPAGLPAIFSGTMLGVEVTWNQVIIRVRDKQSVLDVAFLTTAYGGTGGIDGGSDIAGLSKPYVMGLVENATPISVMTSKLIYQFHGYGPVNSILNVADQGLYLTFDADYSTNAAMQAASIAGGHYVTCKAEGLIRLGGSPAGVITGDCLRETSNDLRTVPQLIIQAAQRAGLTNTEIYWPDAAAVDEAHKTSAAYWITDSSETALNVMDKLAKSWGMYWTFDTLGLLRMGRLTEPAGTPVITLNEANTFKNVERRSASDNNEPIWAAIVGCQKNWTPMTSDFAASVGLTSSSSTKGRNYLTKEFRQARVEDANVKLQYKLAAQWSDDGYLDNQADAVLEATNRLALYKKHRDVFDVPVPLATIMGTSLKMMDVVQLTLSRFGLSSGKLLRVIGIQWELKSEVVILSLWG